MPGDFEEVRGSVEVPKNTGVPGFLKTVERLLKLPRLQEIHIDQRGKVDFRHFARVGEPAEPIEVDFDSLAPYSVIRNSEVVELVDVEHNAAVGLGQLFDLPANDQLFPIAFVLGPTTRFWDWYEQTTGIRFNSHAILYGVPVLEDRMIEDHVLILCASFTRNAGLVDTQRSYKLVIPEVPDEA